MDIPVIDRLEGNPEAQETRARYREIVDALGIDLDRFACRIETKLVGNGEAVVLVTSSKGEAFDIEMCKMAVTMIVALTGLKQEPGGLSPLNSLAIRLGCHPAPGQELTEDEVYEYVEWLIARAVAEVEEEP